jgi:hypothetical protein
MVLAIVAFPLGAATAATMVSRAAAQQKAHPRPTPISATPKGHQRCEGCVNFRAPNATPNAPSLKLEKSST